MKNDQIKNPNLLIFLKNNELFIDNLVDIIRVSGFVAGAHYDKAESIIHKYIKKEYNKLYKLEHDASTNTSTFSFQIDKEVFLKLYFKNIKSEAVFLEDKTEIHSSYLKEQSKNNFSMTSSTETFRYNNYMVTVDYESKQTEIINYRVHKHSDISYVHNDSCIALNNFLLNNNFEFALNLLKEQRKFTKEEKEFALLTFDIELCDFPIFPNYDYIKSLKIEKHKSFLNSLLKR